jgi:hypothetical protein
MSYEITERIATTLVKTGRDGDRLPGGDEF